MALKIDIPSLAASDSTNHILELDFHPDNVRYLKQLQDKDFSSLQRLSLDAFDDNDLDALNVFLQPQLRTFSYYGGPMSDAFLDRLQRSCPQLQEILIDNARGPLTSLGFERFLRGTCSLTSVTLKYGMEELGTVSVLSALGSLPGLHSLALGNIIPMDLGTLKESHLFPQLATFCYEGSLHRLKGLLCFLDHLLELKLTVSDAYSAELHDLIESLPGTCRQLRVLEINHLGAQHSRPDDLPHDLPHSLGTLVKYPTLVSVVIRTNTDRRLRMEINPDCDES